MKIKEYISNLILNANTKKEEIVIYKYKDFNYLMQIKNNNIQLFNIDDSFKKLDIEQLDQVLNYNFSCIYNNGILSLQVI